MKITKTQLRKIIKEELENVLYEQVTAQAIESAMGDRTSPAEFYIDDDGQPLYIRMYVGQDENNERKVVIEYGTRQGQGGRNLGTAINVPRALELLQKRGIDISQARMVS